MMTLSRRAIRPTFLVVGLIGAWVICLAAQTQKPIVQTYQIHGLGTYSCGDFLKYLNEKSTDDSGYYAYVSWMHGYVTGAGNQISVSNGFWDSFVRVSTPDLDASRRAYCQQTKDPVCSIWTNTSLERSDIALQRTTQNGLNAWIEKECAEHPLDSYARAVGKLVLELNKK